MSPLRIIAGLALSTALGLVVGCFRDGSPPPAFRFNCEVDADCEPLTDDDGEPILDADGEPYVEQCIAGLCQFSCSGSVLDFINPSAVSDCPSDNDGYTCFNGTCNHLCDAAADPSQCSAPQTCVEFADFGDLPDLESLLEQLPQEKPGICGILCSADDTSTCPDGQLCFDGVCVDLSGGLPGTSSTGGSTSSGTGTTGGSTSSGSTGSTGGSTSSGTTGGMTGSTGP